MNIWIMRHGEASFNGYSDAERTLTANGVEMAYQQGKWLAKCWQNTSTTLDKILVSPYIRTQQTLAAVISGMQAVLSEQNFTKTLEDKIEIWEGITPMGYADNVLNYLQTLYQHGLQNILLISHLPLVSDLVQELTDYHSQVNFHPAVIAEISWQMGQGSLILSHSPQID